MKKTVFLFIVASIILTASFTMKTEGDPQKPWVVSDAAKLNLGISLKRLFKIKQMVRCFSKSVKEEKICLHLKRSYQMKKTDGSW